jgi:hypothetical protein
MGGIKDRHAEYREDDCVILITHPVSGAKKAFRRTAMAIAWGNPLEIDKTLSNSAIVLAAEAEDHKITVLRAFDADVSLVRRKAIEWKDTFLANRLYAPPEPKGQYEALLREDGLTRYQRKPPYINLLGKPVYKVSDDNVRDHWPSYRNRKTRVSVVPHDNRLLVDFEAASLLVENLIANRHVDFDLVLVPTLEAARKKQLRERLQDVAYRAMVGVVWELYQTMRPAGEGNNSEEKPVWNPWYNRKRR